MKEDTKQASVKDVDIVYILLLLIALDNDNLKKSTNYKSKIICSFLL